MISVIIVLSEIILTLYLFYLHSLLRWGALRKYHSKSYIKKASKSTSFLGRIRGEYIEPHVRHSEPWLIPSIRIVNANFFSVVVIMVASVLAVSSLIQSETFHTLAAILFLKDFALVGYFVILYKQTNRS